MAKTPGLNFYGQSKVITGTCAIISQDRFAVNLSGFSEEVIQIFKTIPSRLYDTKTRIWNFALTDYNVLTERLKNLQSKVTIGKLPAYVLKCMKAPKNEVNIDYNKLDPVLCSSLLPFQLEGLSFGIDKKGRCLIADDMGLGKTFQALAIANYYADDWPVLIVTTASMKTTWEETVANYMPSVPMMSIQYMNSGKDFIGDSKILIVSHDMMTRQLDKLQERSFGIVIVDESHVLKSFKSKCFQSAMTLSKTAKRVILLSGTPALSRPSELYTQLSLIDKSFFGSFYDYSKRYCDGKTTNFGWDASGKSNLQELELILAKKFMIRRTKDDVLQSLPNKKQEIITLDTNLEQFSTEDRDILISLSNKFNQKKGGAKHSALLSFFSETARIKIPSVCSYILQILETKVKFLVFAHHQVMIDAIENLVKKKNAKYIRIDGNTTTDQRRFFISKFQTDDKYMCAILSITAANAGITLTAAQLVLFAELHWNPSIIRQAEARAHRIGQENQVIVRYLIAPGTADDSIWPMLQEKQRTLNQVGLCKEDFNEITVTKQDKKLVTDGLDLNVTRVSNGMADIRTYMTPGKKRKVEDTRSGENSDAFNDGLDDALCKTFEAAEEAFNDGFNDILCDVDF